MIMSAEILDYFGVPGNLHLSSLLSLPDPSKLSFASETRDGWDFVILFSDTYIILKQIHAVTL